MASSAFVNRNYDWQWLQLFFFTKNIVYLEINYLVKIRILIYFIYFILYKKSFCCGKKKFEHNDSLLRKKNALKNNAHRVWFVCVPYTRTQCSNARSRFSFEDNGFRFFALHWTSYTVRTKNILSFSTNNSNHNVPSSYYPCNFVRTFQIKILNISKWCVYCA